MDEPLENKHVLIVEDIIDTGNTLKYIIKYLQRQNPLSIEVTSIVVKKAHEHGIDVKFPGFSIEDKFVVGYGLDYEEKYRNLPYIGYII